MEGADEEHSPMRPPATVHLCHLAGALKTVFLRNEEPLISASPHQRGVRCRKRSEVLRFAQNDGLGSTQ